MRFSYVTEIRAATAQRFWRIAMGIQFGFRSTTEHHSNDAFNYANRTTINFFSLINTQLNEFLSGMTSYSGKYISYATNFFLIPRHYFVFSYQILFYSLKFRYILCVLTYLKLRLLYFTFNSFQLLNVIRVLR